MSDSWLNIRFFQYHLQVGNHQCWWAARISKNRYHETNPVKFEVYTLRFPWVK